MYSSFDSQSEFERSLQMNLTKIALDWKKGRSIVSQGNLDSSKEIEDTSEDNAEGEELGILDLQEIFEDSMAEAGKSIGEMSLALNEMGIALSERTGDIEKVKQQGPVSAKSAKTLVNQAASDMDRFSRMAVPMIENSERCFDLALDAVLKIITFNEGPLDQEEFKQMINLDLALDELTDSIVESDSNMENLEDSVVELPKLSVRFNRSRKGMMDFINAYNRMSQKIRSSIGNTRRSINLVANKPEVLPPPSPDCD